MYNEKMKEIVIKARKAAYVLSVMSSDEKNKVLMAMAEGIEGARQAILEANSIDVANAEKNGKTKAFIDRLKLDDKRISAMSSMLREVTVLDDPVGKVIEKRKRPNGLLIKKVRVPIGVIGIIYEARPNVTADCAALCLKSGNAVILRGGSDAIRSNVEIYKAMCEKAYSQGLPDGAVIVIEDTSRELVDAMLSAVGGIDLIMPRGGEELIKQVVEKSRVPVIKHYKGICHVYVDKKADMTMAENICYNAKVQRPGVCNAMETMLVHEKIAARFLPLIYEKLAAEKVAIKGCQNTLRILAGKEIQPVSELDYYTEYSDLILNVRVVGSLDEAIDHINKYGSGHSDAIVTSSKKTALEFTSRVDSAAVYVNASTRFTDGGEFGLGAEIGISTDKIHARGPMGLEELTIYKYVVTGNGQIRS
ncbi:MAG TPA: glutamate-5-semialdehyde dehydrogenase [Candidatus Omnitrophota bacterium]|nr:glutamate-5-semialdehyde dehydrogenase [Candidatus Omnitrophota bacterium]